MLLQHIDGINLFGLISIASLLYCVPAAIYMESSMWATAWQATVDKIGANSAMQLLALSGLFYHLYNQVSGRSDVCPCMRP
jgi:solute carrier family 35 protein E1